MPPRKLKPKKASDSKGSQKTLDVFIQSSPPRPSPSPTKKVASTSRAGHLTKRRKLATVTQSDEDSDSSDVGAIRFEPEILELSSDSDSDAAPAPSPRKPRLGRAASADSGEEVRELSPTAGRALGRRRDAKGKGKAVDLVEEEEDDDEDEQPRRRKLVRGARPPSPAEAEEDLLDEVDEDRIIESRFRKRDKKSAFQKNLERLKRKKRGQPVASTSEDEEEEEEEEDVIQQLDSSSFALFKGAKPSRAIDSDGESSKDSEGLDDDNFIVADEPDTAAADLPVMFSMNTHQDLSHHFKIICQLFVHLAVQPPGKRASFMKAIKTQSEHEYFLVPLQIARRKLSGLRDSAVTSSVWRPDFKKPLEKYSEISITHLDFSVPHCDACHLGARVSTLMCSVHGVAYDRDTYEPIGAADESEDSDEDEEDVSEIKLDPLATHASFNLGRFCARRTRVFHQLNHWEFTLYQTLKSEVEALQRGGKRKSGYVTVAFAGGMKPPKDLSDADGIMDWLDQRHIISGEWQKIKEMMEAARNLEIAAKRGDADD